MSLAAEPLPADAFGRQIAAQAAGFGLSLDYRSSERLGRFLAELDSWRRRTNLTGPLSGAELVAHALESAFGADLIPPHSRVLDIGSGAGFPGIPIAIVRPDVSMVLLEPRAKRIEFLQHALRAVPVENAEALRGQLRASAFEDLFDCAVERAVGDLPGVVGRGSFLKVGGTLLAWTTSSDELSRTLAGFSPGRVVAVPGSHRKVIAEFLRAA